jgi:hypothetical protein
MSVWASGEFDNHEQVCFFSDEKTRLRAIVAIPLKRCRWLKITRWLPHA